MLQSAGGWYYYNIVISTGNFENAKRFKIQYRHNLIRVGVLIATLALMTVIIVIKCATVPLSSLPETLTPFMTYEIINVYPHDPEAFTQGLIYLDGYLYESTGLYGSSSLRKVDVETGEVLMQIELPPQFFAEGLTNWQNTLVQLTWREGIGFVYNQTDFSLLNQFTYGTEGWGLTRDEHRLILSDGTDHLFFLDPVTFTYTGSIAVNWQGAGVYRLNELEMVNGEVFANIWQTDDIVRIDPVSGEVTGWIDLSGILPESERMNTTDVLNGIAYDPQQDRLFVTGKFWPHLFEIRLVPVLDVEQAPK